MNNCIVLTYWQVVDGANVPALQALLQPGDSCEDITGQDARAIQPDPNAVIWRLRCSDATLAAIEADPEHVVLSAEEVVTDAIV